MKSVATTRVGYIVTRYTSAVPDRSQKMWPLFKYFLLRFRREGVQPLNSTSYAQIVVIPRIGTARGTTIAHFLGRLVACVQFQGIYCLLIQYECILTGSIVLSSPVFDRHL